MSVLTDLFNQYKCDKAAKHHYDVPYHNLFRAKRQRKLKILEVGVYKGDSTRAWLEYFPNADLYGIDTFQRVSIEGTGLSDNPRVHLLQGDSTNPVIASSIATAWPDVLFDLIIDDGLHTPLANTVTLAHLWPFVKDGGTYVVEDVWPLHLMDDQQMKHRWIKDHPHAYTKMNMAGFLGMVQTITDGSFVEIDMRPHSKEPDSYLFALTK